MIRSALSRLFTVKPLPKKGSLEYRMQMDKLKNEMVREERQKKLDEHLQVKIPAHVKSLVLISFVPGLLGAGGIFFSDYLTPRYRRFVRSVEYWLGLNSAFMGGTLIGLEAMRYHPLAYIVTRSRLFIGPGKVFAGFAAVVPPLYMMAMADPESWLGIFWYTIGSATVSLFTMVLVNKGLCPGWLAFVHVPIFINNGIIGILLAYSLIGKSLYVAEMEQLHEKLNTGLYRPEEDKELIIKEK